MFSKRQSFVKGALIISAGGLISKLLGAIYRVPLIAFLGGKGMGIYQMVYPLYCMLLTVSASGLPTGVAKLVAYGKNGAEKRALYVYAVVGAIGSLAMFSCAKLLAFVQGEQSVEQCAKILSPSVFFVSITSVIRGYYQGKGNMLPTATSEIIEQIIKVALGSLLCFIYRADVIKAVKLAVLAVTISEVVATIYVALLYGKEGGKTKPLFKQKTVSIREILRTTLPLTISSLALPASQFLESVVAIRLLRATGLDATTLYGIYSGCAVALVGMPVSVMYGLAVSSVPLVAPAVAKGDFSKAKAYVKKTIALTFLLSLPCAVALYVFCPIASKILFSSLAVDERLLLIKLVRITCINTVTQSLVQTSSACLTALGKPLFSSVSQWFSCLARVGLTALLLTFTNLSIVGVAISANCSYLVAIISNIWYIIRVEKKSLKGEIVANDNFNRSWHSPRRRHDGGGVRA